MTLNRTKRLIAPSILSADFNRLGHEIQDVEKAGCDWIHIDVMDGHFVPNLTLGPPIIRSIRKETKLPFDVHLMIAEPLRYLSDFSEAGSDIITVHLEACHNLKETLSEIKKLKRLCGLSLKPGTSAQKLEPYLKLVDLVLVMTVEPGFGGQSFMPKMLEKVKWLSSRFDGLISVDGGIDLETGRKAAESGANVFVAGSSIFRQSNRKEFIAQFRKAVSI